jgi:hypothetical protein
MARTIIIGCDTQAQSDAVRIQYGSAFTVLALGETEDVLVETAGQGWPTSKYVVIATLDGDTIEGPFPPG